MHARAFAAGLLAALLCGGAAAAAAPPSVVVAVDTSRSLQPETLAAMGETASAALGQLPADAKVSVLAFDDTPRWALISGSPAEAASRLASLRPSGNFTLLDDALFTAARELAPGGVVLLLTDGRDENSATTIEDVARACEARGIRIVAVAAGARPDVRTLRRLSLLTGGSYLGAIDTVQPANAGLALAAVLAAPPPAAVARPASATDQATTATEAAAKRTPIDERAPGAGKVPVAPRTAANVPAAADPSTPAAATSGTAGARPPAVAPSGRRWWWLAPLALVAIAVPAAAWAASRPRHRTALCRRCGNEVPAGEDCPRCAALDSELALQERLRSRDLTRLEDTAELRLDVVELITATTNLDEIEKTRVITDQSMLMVREPGETQRSFLLRNDGAFAVGRDPRSNTLTMRDPALSARHFKVVPDEGMYYVIDLDSTNGTYLNRRRVRAARLATGDVIQAGQVELEFRSFLGQVA
jgi:hypothetical protein